MLEIVSKDESDTMKTPAHLKEDFAEKMKDRIVEEVDAFFLHQPASEFCKTLGTLTWNLVDESQTGTWKKEAMANMIFDSYTISNFIVKLQELYEEYTASSTK